jgi:hypothetical protein
MLTIKDLSMDKELDAKEMSAVRGGSDFSFNGGVSVSGGTGNNISFGDGNTLNNSNDTYRPYPYHPMPPCFPHKKYY